MTEYEFDMLIKRAFTEHFDEYIPESEIDNTPHKFSRRFEKKMRKLIKNSGEPVVQHKKITGKRLFVCITAAIVAACVMALSVSAVREALVNFITNIFSTHTEVQSVQDDSAPLEFIDKYELTADMSEFELIVFSEDVFKREYIYENEHYTVHFRQFLKEYYDVSENTEGYDMEIVNVNGLEGYYIDMYEINIEKITWDNGEYIFSLFVLYEDDMYKIDKNKMVEFAKSVQKVE